MTHLLLFVASNAFAAPPSPPQPPAATAGEHGGGQRGDHGKGDYGVPINLEDGIEQLALTADQRSKVETACYDSKAAGIDLSAKADRTQLDLHRSLQSSVPYDEKAVLKAFEAAATAEADVKRNDLKLALTLRKILTAEQWVELKELRQERRTERRERRQETVREKHHGESPHDE